jgi:hypothetical protein
MSYIPKYILKRMFPKDCVKAADNGVTVSMVNVISPLSIDDGIPDDAENHVDVNIDGKALDAETKKKLSFTIDGTTYTIAKAIDFQGVVIPVGGKIEVFLPGSDLKAGEEHEFEIIIKTDNPFQLKFKRTIN